MLMQITEELYKPKHTVVVDETMIPFRSRLVLESSIFRKQVGMEYSFTKYSDPGHLHEIPASMITKAKSYQILISQVSQLSI